VLKYGLGMRYACIGPFETRFRGLSSFTASQKPLPSSAAIPRADTAAVAIENNRWRQSGSGFYEYPGGPPPKQR
jgi:hypothetical protein